MMTKRQTQQRPTKSNAHSHTNTNVVFSLIKLDSNTNELSKIHSGQIHVQQKPVLIANNTRCRPTFTQNILIFFYSTGGENEF